MAFFDFIDRGAAARARNMDAASNPNIGIPPGFRPAIPAPAAIQPVQPTQTQPTQTHYTPAQPAPVRVTQPVYQVNYLPEVNRERQMADEALQRSTSQAHVDRVINSSLRLTPGMSGFRVGGVAQGSRTFNSQGRGGVVPPATGGYGRGFVPPATGGYNNPNPFRSLNGPLVGSTTGGYGPSRAGRGSTTLTSQTEASNFYDERTRAGREAANRTPPPRRTGGGFRFRTQAERNASMGRPANWRPNPNVFNEGLFGGIGGAITGALGAFDPFTLEGLTNIGVSAFTGGAAWPVWGAVGGANQGRQGKPGYTRPETFLPNTWQRGGNLLLNLTPLIKRGRGGNSNEPGGVDKGRGGGDGGDGGGGGGGRGGGGASLNTPTSQQVAQQSGSNLGGRPQGPAGGTMQVSGIIAGAEPGRV